MGIQVERLSEKVDIRDQETSKKTQEKEESLLGVFLSRQNSHTIVHTFNPEIPIVDAKSTRNRASEPKIVLLNQIQSDYKAMFSSIVDRAKLLELRMVKMKKV